VAISFDYFRAGRRMSLRGKVILPKNSGVPSSPVILSEAQQSRRICGSFWCGKGRIRRSNILLVLALASVLPALAQYPGQVTKSSKDAPELRAIAVLEWTGEAGSPKASRLVPVAVLDQGRILADQLQDGGIYMARPEPLALTGEVEYELQQDGKPIGLFDIKNAGQEQGSWVGYGAWKRLPLPKPKPSMEELARIHPDEEDSDRPTLHRKHHSGDSGTPASGDGSGSTGSGSTEPAPTADSDRPTLHKKDSSDSSGDSSKTSTAPTPSADPDRPTLHKKTTSDNTGTDSSTSSAPSGDSDRPVLKKSSKKQPEDVGHVDSLPDVTDPNRPRLKRGLSTGNGLEVLPTLMGMPAEMQQTVAVSDARSHPEHPWAYTQTDPDTEAKMKSDLEDVARDALGLNPPAPTPKRVTTQKAARKNTMLPPEPLPLSDERFRVFELAYGSGATLVFSAHTDGPLAQQKFVTLIAQPDLYGNVRVVLKNVTDGAHLDETPRMRLVDAVDALADNRGELLFELRGATQRQFALYRILRGQAEKLFVTAAGTVGTENRE